MNPHLQIKAVADPTEMSVRADVSDPYDLLSRFEKARRLDTLYRHFASYEGWGAKRLCDEVDIQRGMAHLAFDADDFDGMLDALGRASAAEIAFFGAVETEGAKI